MCIVVTVTFSSSVNPSQMVVVWSTMNATKSTIGMIGSALHGGPPSMEVKGTSSQFVDPGTLHHTQYIHTVTFTGLKPGASYGKFKIMVNHNFFNKG